MQEMLNTRDTQFRPSKKIVDVGEKIEGARKDVLKAFASLLGDVTKERLATNPLSRVFKKLNLDRAVKSGALREIDAIFYDAVLLAIDARKPHIHRIDLAHKRENPSYRTCLDSWVDSTHEALMLLRRFVLLDFDGRDEMLKELEAKRFINVDADKQRAQKIKNIDGSEPEIGTRYTPDPLYVRFEILKRIGHKHGEKIDIPTDKIIPNDTLTSYSVYGGLMSFPPEDDLDAVINHIVDRMKSCYSAKNSPKVPLKSDVDVSSTVEAGNLNKHQAENLRFCGVTPSALLSVFSEQKGCSHFRFWVEETNKCFKNILKEFSSLNEAFVWRDKVKESYFLIWKEAKIARKSISRVCTSDAKSVMSDSRNGRNIGAEDFMNAFGFRGVQFGNWTDQSDRQKFVNQAFDAFVDLAKVIGISPKMLSLNNELGLAFGARGYGTFAAHYELHEVVINLTKNRGAGVLAHEWWHALDNYFARSAGVKFGMLSEDEQIPVSDDVQNVFGSFVKKLTVSNYAARSRALGVYWGRMSEITARFFETWVVWKQKERGCFNSYLASNVCADKLIEYNYDVYCRQMRNAKVDSISFDEFRDTNRAYEGFPYPNEQELRECDLELRNVLGLIGLDRRIRK